MQYLESQQMSPGGHMAVAMVLMESPAILMAVLLANMIRQKQASAQVVAGQGGNAAMMAEGGGNFSAPSMGKVIHESFTSGAHLLLLASLLIGYLSGEAGKVMMQTFSTDLFKGMLAFFLLDMGLMVARSMRDVQGKSPILIAYAALAPVVHAGIALLISMLLSLPVADAALIMVLSASASYIVVPAVLRYAIPEANPSLYLGLSLGVTFPLNILFGIPFYTEVARTVLG
jgi:hypothetical protein